MDTEELVVLLADDGQPIGTAAKYDVHHETTPLHLAFSCHVFDEEGRMLMTRRALTKKTWPGVWTNSFCGHPAPGESMEDALRRRARQELGLDLTEITSLLPDFRYSAIDASGVVENEICPVFAARAVSPVIPDAAEVAEYAWVEPHDLRTAVRAAPWAFSPWFGRQLDELDTQEKTPWAA